MTKSPNLNFAIQSLYRLVLVLPFNLIFFLVPGLITFTVILTFWTITSALLIFTFLGPTVALQTDLLSLSTWTIVATFSTALFALFASIFIGSITFYITKSFSSYVIQYIVWNFKFIFQIQKQS